MNKSTIFNNKATIMISATARKTEWHSILKKLKAASRSGNKKAMNSQCEVTIFRDGKVDFVTAGISVSLHCRTTGTVRFICQYEYLAELIESVRSREVTIAVKDEEVTVGLISFKTSVTYFDNDSVLRTIKLPIDYDDAWLIRLIAEGYTKEEIHFNRLYVQIELALQRLELRISKAHSQLKEFGVKKSDLRELVYNNLGILPEQTLYFK